MLDAASIGGRGAGGEQARSEDIFIENKIKKNRIENAGARKNRAMR